VTTVSHSLPDPMAATIAQALRILAECGRQRRTNRATANAVNLAEDAFAGLQATHPTPEQTNGGDGAHIIEQTPEQRQQS